MFDFKKLFPKTEPPLTRVQALRAMVIGKTTVEVGEEFDLTAAELANFDSQDVRVLSRPSDLVVVTDPTPPRPEVVPAGERWAALPKCFADWWDINERFRVARKHLEILREARIREFGTDADLYASGTNQVISDGYGANQSKNVLVLRYNDNPDRANKNISVTNYNHDLNDPAFKKIVAFHHNAKARAEEHLEELKKAFGLKIQRLHLECGNQRIASVAALQEIISEVREIGLSLFTMRVSALELAETKIRELYAGSSLAVKYGSQTDPSLPGLCSAGYAADGTLRIYIEDSVPDIAGGMFHDAERMAVVKPLLVEARKELAKANKNSPSVAA